MPDADQPSGADGQRTVSDASIWDSLSELPDIDDAPLDAAWMPSRPQVAPTPPPTAATETSAGDHQPAAPAGPDQRQFRIGPSPQPSAPPVSRPPQPTTTPEPGWPAEWGEPEAPVPPKRRRRRQPRRRWWLVALVFVPLAAFISGAVYSWYLWGQVEKIDTDGALSAGSDGFTNYLIVGVDSRDGVDPALGPQVGLRAGGNLSDTMLVLHVGDGGNRLVSLPRDLWVSIDGSSGAKLNVATAIGGAPALIRTVQDELTVPVHRYLEVDIAGFLSVIEAVGSITIEFDAPACDPKSKLDVRETGMVELGPEQALAYVRSRTYTTFDAALANGLTCEQIRAQGLGTTVGVSDFGRTERQREFLNAVFGKLSGTRNPVTLLAVLSGLTDGLRVDDQMTVFHAFQLFRDIRGLNAEPQSIPVSDFTAPNGTAALSLNAGSDSVLDPLRTGSG